MQWYTYITVHVHVLSAAYITHPPMEIKNILEALKSERKSYWFN